MSTDHESKATHRSVVWPAVAVLIPIVYVLSVGPFVWLMTGGGSRGLPVGEGSAFGTLYAPLIWLAEQSDWIAALFEGYIRWVVS